MDIARAARRWIGALRITAEGHFLQGWQARESLAGDAEQAGMGEIGEIPALLRGIALLLTH